MPKSPDHKAFRNTPGTNSMSDKVRLEGPSKFDRASNSNP